ncbi:nuclear distribution protein nudF-2 [Ditylenchus destructor]|uniref:Nuclear distribution protein nudF-2 n=1 Tax=Ditylenchus destructor TaxID=166010 RepID=A0AAD4N8L9_9BILA|nr:nuclear distribution protein nudF-2 [Ditylenchus destructor]
MSLITGDFWSVEPDGMDNQMAIEKVAFTHNQQILLWSTSQFYLYDLDGRLIHRERLDQTLQNKDLIYVFFISKRSVRLLAVNQGDKDDWNVTISGREEDRQIRPFIFSASMVFFDETFRHGACCVAQHVVDEHNMAVALSCGETVFIAGIRRNLYIWNINSSQLVRTVDAHFGRILNVQALNVNNHNLLISSSIDRSIKIWNMENIFEKSFALDNMDEPIEKILVAQHKPNLAIAQTRKYLGIWDIKSQRFITSLVSNSYGSVVSDSLITSDGRHVVCIESDHLLVWDLKTHSVVFRHLDTPEQKVARLAIYRLADLTLYYTHEYPCRMFRDVVALKDTTTVVAVVFYKGHDHLHVIDVAEKVVRHKFRPRAMRKQQKDIIVLGLVPVMNSTHHCVVMDGESRGSIWDVKNKKLVRHLPNFTAVCTEDGKFGLHAPTRGGLHIVDLKNGALTKMLIGQVAEGVNDVQARFTPNGDHVLYYHNGQQTLRCFRVSDGQLIGTLRPHAQITTWGCNGEKVVIGCQDGSLLTAILYDDTSQTGVQRALAALPSRRYLADHLGIGVDDLDNMDNLDLRNLGVITKAITKFKQPLRSKTKGSVVCSVQ